MQTQGTGEETWNPVDPSAGSPYLSVDGVDCFPCYVAVRWIADDGATPLSDWSATKQVAA